MSRLSARTLRAHATRALVFSLLGGRCAKCQTNYPLEVDVIASGSVDHHDAGNLRRAQIYLDLAKRGLVQLLCKNCHREKTRLESRLKRGLPSPIANDKFVWLQIQSAH